MGRANKLQLLIAVVCGPSGSGKSSLIQKLFKEYPEHFGFSVSHTTRSPRPGEKNGIHYFFTTKEEIEKGISQGKFLESANFSGNVYGTSLESVQRVCNEGKVCLLDIEIEGVKQLKRKDLDPILIFVKPPSIADLEQRLRSRGTETEESIRRRLETAKAEMAYGETPGNFQIIITNDNIENSYKIFKSFVLTELCKRGVHFGEDYEGQ